MPMVGVSVIMKTTPTVLLLLLQYTDDYSPRTMASAAIPMSCIISTNLSWLPELDDKAVKSMLIIKVAFISAGSHRSTCITHPIPFPPSRGRGHVPCTRMNNKMVFCDCPCSYRSLSLKGHSVPCYVPSTHWIHSCVPAKIKCLGKCLGAVLTWSTGPTRCTRPTRC